MTEGKKQAQGFRNRDCWLNFRKLMSHQRGWAIANVIKFFQQSQTCGFGPKTSRTAIPISRPVSSEICCTRAGLVMFSTNSAAAPFFELCNKL